MAIVARTCVRRTWLSGRRRGPAARGVAAARHRVLVLVAVVSASVILGSSLSASAATGAPAQAIDPGVFTPVADTYVDASRPTSSYGGRTYLRTDGSPLVTSFIRFDVADVSDFSSAQLRLYVEAGSPIGLQIRSVADTAWDEATTTYATAPAVGDVVASSGPVGWGTWVTLDVSALVGSNGPVAMAVTTGGFAAMRLSSREGGNPPQLLVPGPSSPSPFVVMQSATGYEAVSQTTNTTYSGPLDQVVEAAAVALDSTGGGTISFAAGTFDLGGASLRFQDIEGVTFEGQGVGVTILRNLSGASVDTEVLAFTRATGVVVRDMTVSAGGPPRSTSDGIAFIDGNDSVIERVAVIASRSRGIVLDGGSAGASADGNVVRDCVIDGVRGDGIQLIAARDNLIEGCSIVNVGGHGVQWSRSPSSSGPPTVTSDDNVLRANTIENPGLDGVRVDAGNRNTVIGNLVSNSGNVIADRYGIRISAVAGATCDDNVVRDNVARDNQEVKTQRYGLVIGSFCQRTYVSGNDFRFNRVGEIIDLGVDTVIVGDTEPPSIPGELLYNVKGPFEVELQWDSATDNEAVAGYTVYRDDVPIATTGPLEYFYRDLAVEQNTTYRYAVDSFDTAGNHSDPSAEVILSTPQLAANFSVSPTADAYVNSSNPGGNYGSSSTLRIDKSPEVLSYLRFDVRGIAPTLQVDRATLRVYANSTSFLGHEIHGVSDNTWDEHTITFDDAPPVGPVLGSSGTFSTVGFVDVDVTPFITGNGTFSLAITTESNTAVSYASREAGHKPLLMVETGPPPPPPATGTLFADDFETGDLSAWTSAPGFTATQNDVAGGLWAGLATNPGGSQVYARAALAGLTSEATFAMMVNVVSKTSTDTLYLMRARYSVGDALMGVYVSPSGQLGVRNDRTGGAGSITSATTVTPGWHELRVHVVAGGDGGSLMEVWLDDVLAVSRTDTLPTGNIQTLEIGDRNIGEQFILAFDDVEVTAP